MKWRLFLIALGAVFLFLSPYVTASELKPTTIPGNFGVNIHFTDKNIEQHVALLKEAGFGWVRKDLNWARIEKEKGVYDFSLYDPLITALNHAGIKVLLILDYTNPNYDDNLSPYTVEGRHAFAQFATAAARHYSHANVAWEIYNEPNWSFWKPFVHLDNYMALAREVTKAMHQIKPRPIILAPALAGPAIDPEEIKVSYIYLDAVLQNPIARMWDAISIHPYRGNKNPETVLDEIPRLQSMLAKHHITAPLMFSEWGYHTSDKGIDETMQAAYAARSFLISAALQMPFSIWYNWQEIGPDSSDSEQKFGLIRDGTVDPQDEDIRKPAFHAVRALAKALSGYQFDSMLHHTNGIYCLRFVKDGQFAYAAWTTRKTATPFHLPLKGGNWRMHTLKDDIDPSQEFSGDLKLEAIPLIISLAQ